MSKTAIVNTGRNYFVKQLSNKNPIVLDKFIFANIADINGDSNIDLNTTIPTNNIVYSAPVTQAGLIGESAVAYSIILDSQIGNFDFNFVGLMNAETNTLCMVMHCDITHKVKNNGASQGNTLTQTLWLEIDNAAQSTGITVNAETWQIDFSERMAGEDERIRLSNLDIYDRLAIHSGINISKVNEDSYTISTGLAYVAGLRVQIDTPVTITATPGQSIYIDAWMQGSVTGAWTIKYNIISGNNYTDYKNGIFEHYIEPIATIDAIGNLVLAKKKSIVNSVNNYTGDVLITPEDINALPAKLMSGMFNIPDNTVINDKEILTPLLASIKSDYGYIEFPTIVNGERKTLIIQWGKTPELKAGSQTKITLPISYDNEHLTILTSRLGVQLISNSGYLAEKIGDLTKNDFKVYVDGNNASSSLALRFLSIGY